jgi:hypothetical protein
MNHIKLASFSQNNTKKISPNFAIQKYKKPYQLLLLCVNFFLSLKEAKIKSLFWKEFIKSFFFVFKSLFFLSQNNCWRVLFWENDASLMWFIQ